MCHGEQQAKCSFTLFAEEARRLRELKKQQEMEEMREAGIHHIPTKKKSDELLAAEEHSFESLELGAHIQVDYNDSPDQKASEHVFYFLRQMDTYLPEKVSAPPGSLALN